MEKKHVFGLTSQEAVENKKNSEITLCLKRKLYPFGLCLLTALRISGY